MSLPFSDHTNAVISLRTGQQYALDSLFEEYYQALVYFAFRMIRSREDAQDIAIESFAKLWEKREGFENYQNIKGFLYLTTRNACIDYFRRTQKDRLLKSALHHLSDTFQEETTGLEQIRAETLRKITEEMEKLPQQCRSVFELSVIRGLKSRQIADQLNISVSNVTSQKSRAVHILRAALLKGLKGVFFWIG